MRNIIISLITLLTLTGCMHNNGDIGNFFGVWKVESINIDNEIDNNYNGDIFFLFQSDVVRLVQNRGNYDVTEYYGSWIENDSHLILDFHYYVEQIKETYNLPEITYLQKSENHITILSQTAKRMVWQFNTIDKTITYNLIRQ